MQRRAAYATDADRPAFCGSCQCGLPGLLAVPTRTGTGIVREARRDRLVHRTVSGLVQVPKAVRVLQVPELLNVQAVFL